MPLVVIVIGIAIASLLLRYEPPNYSEITSRFDDVAAVLGSRFASEQEPRAIKFVRKSTYTSADRSEVSTITSEVIPIRHGWVVRIDNWRDQYNQALIYQERYVLYRGLFGVHTQYREIAPFFHELFGSLGWFSDEVVSLEVLPSANFPREATSTVSILQKRLTNTDWRSASMAPGTYERRIDCKHDGMMYGTKIHASIRGEVPTSVCTSTYTNDFPTRTSRVAYLAEFGLYVTLESNTKIEAQLESTSNEFIEFKSK
jgi:hypothetical protein